LQVLKRKPERKLRENLPQKQRKLLPIKNTQKFPTQKGLKSFVSSYDWIGGNNVSLKKAGFTERDLYNKLWPKGIALLPLWSHPGLQVKLNEKTIFFTWRNSTGRKITQTCRPEKQPQTRVSKWN